MTDTSSAAALRALHRPGDPLVLPNAWDAGSARTVAAAGFPAVATSSAAAAESLGHADGETTPVAEMLDAVTRVVRAVAVPVTADLERGYGLLPAELVERLLATGAVGLNLEDSDPRTKQLCDVDEQAELLAAVRAAAGPDLVVNARVDVFLRGTGDHAGEFDEAVRRARRYREAGADCVYPIVLADPELVGRFVAAAGGPVNVLLQAGTPGVAELARLGVARVSLGAGVYAAAQARAAAMLAALASGDDPFAG
ncbi:isocitrate lyase/PEP mutase family protein [Micromonospora sp. DT47]|uniref:isocitrate lyase/PEP mutase family protein n=1 Tax=Micromonospora sp. DT47 TaxID=3393431 RepID=UPI003CF1C136